MKNTARLDAGKNAHERWRQRSTFRAQASTTNGDALPKAGPDIPTAPAPTD
jgi:hypothetical protein